MEEALGLALRPCTAEDRAKCRAEMPDPAHLAWACAKCKQARPEEINPYTAHILEMLNLQQGGFPFGPDDLDLNTWRDMGLVKQGLDNAKETKRWTNLMTSIFGSRSAPKA